MKRYTERIRENEYATGNAIIKELKIDENNKDKDYILERQSKIIITLDNKLGKLEDLLQSYSVEDLQELNMLLGMATAYEELSKQLGCPLDVVFKALKGFYYKNNVGGITQAEKPITITFDEISKTYYLESGDNEWTPYQNVPLTLYKKTWWLKEDKSK